MGGGCQVWPDAVEGLDGWGCWRGIGFAGAGVCYDLGMHKPTSMMVLGILNICFAALGLMGALYAVVSPFLPIPGTEIFEDAYQDGTFLAVLIGVTLVGVLSKLAMAASGFGLVKGRAWGRSLGNAWAVFSMVYGLAAVVLAVTYTMPAMDAAVTAYSTQYPNKNAQAVQQYWMMDDIMLVIVVVQGTVQALAYQILFLCLNNRKPVRDYLAQQG